MALARKPKSPVEGELTAPSAEGARALLAAIVDSSRDAIYAGDMNGVLLYWNAGAERLYGYSAAEILGKSVGILFPPDHDRELERIMEGVRHGDPPAHYEAVRRRKDGTLVPVANTVSPVRDARGVVIGASVIGRDITERRVAEQALRASEEKFERMFMAVPAGIGLSDFDDARFLDVNEEFAKIFGYARAEMIGRGSVDLGIWQDPRDRDELVAAMAAGGVRRGVEIRARTRQGVPLTLHASFDLMHVGGRLVLLSTFIDLTARHQAEAERHRAEARYRELVEGVRDVIFSLDLNGAVTSLNRAFERLSGLRVADWVGRPFAELLHPDDVARASQMFGAALRGEHPASAPFRIRTAGEGHRVGDVLLAPQIQDGRVSSVLGIGRDVTDQLELENQFRQSQKMEAVGRLAGGVAHDFNNLLTVIISSGQMLLEDWAPSAPGRQDVEEIVTAGQRAAELTRQLLAFSRRQVLEPRTLDLNVVVANVEKLLRRLIGEDVTLLTVPARDLRLIRADPGQIEQVIANLVVNARDAMPQGGTVTVSTANVDLSESDVRDIPGATTGPRVMLSIRDTGTGMSDEVKAHIFEPFFTTKASGKGTGLGLSTVYGIVQQSGGHIRVRSAPGRGTTFEICLPLARALSERAGRPAPEAGTPRGHETVLIAEDNASVRDVAARVLRSHGYTVLEAETGEAALDLAGHYPGRIDLLLADVVMPKMSGRLLADHLLAARSGLRVLFVSGYTDEALAPHGMLEEGIALLQKPFEPLSLARKVREVLDRRADSPR